MKTNWFSPLFPHCHRESVFGDSCLAAICSFMIFFSPHKSIPISIHAERALGISFWWGRYYLRFFSKLKKTKYLLVVCREIHPFCPPLSNDLSMFICSNERIEKALGWICLYPILLGNFGLFGYCCIWVVYIWEIEC